MVGIYKFVGELSARAKRQRKRKGAGHLIRTETFYSALRRVLFPAPKPWTARQEHAARQSSTMRSPIDKGTALTCRPHIGLIHP